jgi:hypothetical protein
VDPATLGEVVTGHEGEGAGVVGETPNGGEKVPCRVVLLATNGVGANEELVEGHLPTIAGAVYHGSSGSQGDALRIGERALETDPKAGGDRARQHGLPGAGHIFQKHMSFAEQRDHDELHSLALADNDTLNILDQRMNKLLDIIHAVVSLVRGIL